MVPEAILEKLEPMILGGQIYVDDYKQLQRNTSGVSWLC